MIEKRTVINQIFVDRNGVIQLRFAKEIVEDGVVISRGYHKTVVHAETDFDAQMDSVDDHLRQLKCAPVDTADRAWIKSMRNTVQTPERNQRWREKKSGSER